VATRIIPAVKRRFTGIRHHSSEQTRVTPRRDASVSQDHLGPIDADSPAIDLCAIVLIFMLIVGIYAWSRTGWALSGIMIAF
jgi:hypothetical protein